MSYFSEYWLFFFFFKTSVKKKTSLNYHINFATWELSKSKYIFTELFAVLNIYVFRMIR